MNLIKIIVLSFTLCFQQVSIAQDTLRINLIQAEQRFLENNYQILASSMNIEAQKAEIIQARIYPNPVFTAAINAYDSENNKAFHVDRTGQKFFQLEQLIILGGKRKAEIEMAKTNAAIAELEFQQLVLQLKFTLRRDLFEAAQLEQLIKRYNSQLTIIREILSAYEEQASKGNIPLKDVVRLKGAYLKLNNDRSELMKTFYEKQLSLQTLLQTESIVKFEYSESEFQKYIQVFDQQELLTIAYENRPDLKIIQNDKILAEQYLSYNKRLAVPDINVFANYDQLSGAFRNEVNAGISIPLPFWNRNQGKVKVAQAKMKQADYTLQAMENEMRSSIQNGIAFYHEAVSDYQKTMALFNEDFDVTFNGMTENFTKRNVSILEFIDFFEAYNDAINEVSRTHVQLVNTAETLNLLIGKETF